MSDLNLKVEKRKRKEGMGIDRMWIFYEIIFIAVGSLAFTLVRDIHNGFILIEI